MTPATQRLYHRAKASYGAEALAEFAVGLLFAWGTLSADSPIGVRLGRAGIGIIFLLAALQSFENWRHPDTERVLFDSARRVVDALRLTARMFAAIAAVAGFALRFLTSQQSAHDLATDLLIVFAAMTFVDRYLLGQLARD